MVNIDENVVPTNIVPWKALCKNETLLEIAFFSSKPNCNRKISINHIKSIVSVHFIAFLCNRKHKVTLCSNYYDSTDF